MSNYESELREYTLKLDSQIKGINKILNLNTNGLLEDEVEEKLLEIRGKAERLLKKLQNNEFEVSIVGLEKAGKSSFANAIIGNDILPSKEARCTYTSTSIRYGDNTAIVHFFSREEFAKGFQIKLKKLGIEHPEIYTYEKLSLEKYQKIFEALDEETKERYGTNVNEDIENILTYKENLSKFIGTKCREFRGETELESDYFKGFIQNPEFAIAVKEIILYSDKLQNMKNVVIYDVPGFDSPTQMHKEQTLQKMRTADAIILITSAYRPSFTGPLVDIFRNESDEDGIKFGDKMFVFANMADRAEKLKDNMNDICYHLSRYNIMSDGYFKTRVIPGSARAKLEADGKIEGTMAIDSLKKLGIEDGIETITKSLENYNQTERFEVLKGKVNRLQSDIRAIFENKFLDDEYTGFDSNCVIAKLATKKLDESRALIVKNIEEYRAEFKNEYSPEKHLLTDKMKENVIAGINVEKFGITDDEFEIACNHNDSIHEVFVPKDVDMYLRKEKYPVIYNAFSDNVIELAIQEHEKCDNDIRQIFEKCIGISEHNPYYKELINEIDEFIEKQKKGIDNSGYYKSLIERFSVDLFEILIKFSYGDMSRWSLFEKARSNFYSLSMYSDNFDNQLPPGEQAIHYMILFHSNEQKVKSANIKKILEMVENIAGVAVNTEIFQYIKIIALIEKNNAIDVVKKVLGKLDIKQNSNQKQLFVINALENIVEKYKDQNIDVSEKILTKESYEEFFNGKRDKYIEDVRNEIDEDISILQEILNETVVNAICIETPFLALETQTMKNIIDMVNGEEYRQFIANNIPKICVDEYRDLCANDQKKMAYTRMMEEIKLILENIKNSNF